jgi:hypothetical protein
MKRSNERGSAMLITMIVISALLAGAAVLVSLQLGANKGTDLTRSGISALYCAEAGLTASRAIVAEQQADWANWLQDPALPVEQKLEPTWLATVDHDVDGDSQGPDWKVWLEDNFDEVGTDAPLADSDGRVFIVSRCLKYPDNPREVRELVGYRMQQNCYTSQRGGCGGNGNMNAQAP